MSLKVSLDKFYKKVYIPTSNPRDADPQIYILESDDSWLIDHLRYQSTQLSIKLLVEMIERFKGGS